MEAFLYPKILWLGHSSYVTRGMDIRWQEISSGNDLNTFSYQKATLKFKVISSANRCRFREVVIKTEIAPKGVE